jgi:bacteriorhodopsin
MTSYQTDLENSASFGTFETVEEYTTQEGSNKKAYGIAAAGFAFVLCATLATGGNAGAMAAGALALNQAAVPLSAAAQALTVQIAGLQTQLAAASPAAYTLPPGVSESDLSVDQFNLIYNFLSMVTAAMGASTLFFFFQFSVIDKAFKNALLVSSMVTLIACYHYFRIFGSFNDCYYVLNNVVYATGSPFNDAYRYVDWFLTVPLLLIELILVMQLESSEASSQMIKLGFLSALMVVLGYPGEVTSNMNVRWAFWAAAMLPFIVIVYTLIFGLKESIDKQPAAARDLVAASVWITALSWCTYPVVYVFPMIGFHGASAQTAVQVGYSVADVIAKPILGLVVWRIAVAKSSK